MEIFQTIWTALSTPNEALLKVATIPLGALELTIIMYLFLSILNIQATKKQKVIYVISLTVLSIITQAVFDKSIYTIINTLSALVLLKIVFKTDVLSSIIAMVFPYFMMIGICSILMNLYIIIFDITTEITNTVPIYRISFSLISYVLMFIIYKLFKNFNFNITLLNKTNNKSGIVLLINFIIGFIAIAAVSYISTLYTDVLPLGVTLSFILILLVYFLVSFYSLSRTSKLEVTTRNLEEEKLYNKTLTILHDNIRAFKHDFNNIVQAIGGYVSSNDMAGLKKYYSQLLDDCQRVNNLNTLSPDVINNPAIYSLLASKYYKADELGIKINLEIFLDLNSINMKIYEFTRILGILLDNAIEATNECEEKIINVMIRKDNRANRQVAIVENTYMQKDINIDKIFEKSYSTKPNNTGLGLWEVRQILKKSTNLNLFTTKNDKFFIQQLEIY